MRPVASSVSLQSAAAKAAALPEARRRRPEQQEGSGSHPAEADRRGSSGAEGPTIITDFVDRRGGSSRQTGFTGHTTHENACDRRPQENRCPSHKQIFSTNPPRALGAGTAKPVKFTFFHLLSGISSQRWLAYLPRGLSNDHCRKTLICAINRVLFVSLRAGKKGLFLASKPLVGSPGRRLEGL